MSTVMIEPFVGRSFRRSRIFHQIPKRTPFFSLNYSRRPLSGFATLRLSNYRRCRTVALRASSTETSAVVETSEKSDVTFPVQRSERAEGKIVIRLDKGRDEENWHLSVGCNLPGKWILHWGVHYSGETGSEWDQPPPGMRPSGSIAIKDYAIETPLIGSSKNLEGETFQEVKIDISSEWSVAAINFVLKDEETGVWYQHRGRDFKIPLMDYLEDDANIVGSSMWPGPLGQLSSILLKPVPALSKEESNANDGSSVKIKRLEGFYDEHPILKETIVDNTISVSVNQCPETYKNILHIDTDLPGNVVLHWGVCKDDVKRWELPSEPYPAETVVFKNKALRTLLQKKEGGNGSSGSFTLDGGLSGFAFVVKLDENMWLNCKGDDFYIPLPSGKYQSSKIQMEEEKQNESKSSDIVDRDLEDNQTHSVFTDGIIMEIRHLVSDISSEKNRKTKSKEAQENILQEIEKLAAEAYSIFRSSIPTLSEDSVKVSEAEVSQPDVKVSSGTGSGFEILCQGFNWESHKSGQWYMELHEKATELSSLGFSVIWLPPPTDSVSPEGYMPRDLYNLNSRYGSFDQLKDTVKRFHEMKIKVLGDVVLNHRCASQRNQNGIWNIFGGRLNWDDRAVVADDPHFQGRGNKSSGDNFHAAPNIDHSQEFVRKDIKEWLHWLREEIGYDGWRLDFVRGFWGGYVKDYIESTEPYFAVGEYWDSLSYTYGEMDHNQDAHRQRIVDWINATNGTAGAFDVTTKGILHSAIERCEYWRLSDQSGKPPGVVGWWPSRAVTFIENHDTGSTQGHWRFPGGKEMQGYAYILTHPGTPSVFFDHIFSSYHSEIGALISLRKRNKIHCRSTVIITRVERDVYAAVVDDKVAVKIGPGHYEPPTGQSWKLATEGNDYKVWELS